MIICVRTGSRLAKERSEVLFSKDSMEKVYCYGEIES